MKGNLKPVIAESYYGPSSWTVAPHTNPAHHAAPAARSFGSPAAPIHQVREQTATSLSTAHHTPVVFVVDDDASVRRSLELLIRSQGWQPETFASAQEFLSRPPVLAPSCLILDVSLPDLNGLDVQKRIAVDRIDMPIIFITGHGDVPMTVQAMKAGAVEFLTKPFRGDVLSSAIQHALERSKVTLAQESETQALRDCYASLSSREREVMALVVSGLLNKQVGAELGISEITVKAHRGQVMRKMKADSLPDLVNMASRLRLTPAPKN
ncbi:MAG: DNA-binding response regulator [Proteobacteria bacterium]|nr:MAG: DNA-binding response regulator [Pseudomonadota bacterium]